MVLQLRVRCCALLLVVVVAPALQADELITNGDFEQGNKGFKSQFPYSPDSVLDAPTYAIAKNPRDVHRDAVSFRDRSGKGSMLVFNANGGEREKQLVWGQTVEVLPKGEYVFSLWVAQWYSIGGTQLDVRINGKSVGKASCPKKAGAWQEFKVTWNSENEKTAVIEILNLTRSNLAIDDISLQGTSVLPKDAVDRIQEFEAEVEVRRQKAEAEISALREKLIKDLQKLQDTYTKAGKLDEALALRARIQQLKAEAKAKSKD